MNHAELEAILNKARPPERSEEFFETFPQKVAMQLNRVRTQSPRVERHRFPRLAWALASAICVLVAFVIGYWRAPTGTETISSKEVLTNAKFISETLAMFPNRVRAIMQDEHGLSLILSDSNNVPASAPLYVRVCDGKQCASVVTFSGQEIQIAGQRLLVLSDAQGGIILEGNRFVWSSGGKNYAEKNLEIEAKNLDTTL
jgi:hypothetical protein